MVSNKFWMGGEGGESEEDLEMYAAAELPVPTATPTTTPTATPTATLMASPIDLGASVKHVMDSVSDMKGAVPRI
jgi:hypothetical protein